MSIKKNSKVAKAASAFVGFTTALMMVGSTAVLPASAATIDELLAQIAVLTAQLNALKGGSTTTTGAGLSGVTFTMNLKMGSTGEEVRNLQKVLNTNASTQVALTGAGSPGNETSYFGPATRAAVIKFQNWYASDILAPLGLTTGTGTVGPSTRAKLNTIAAGSVVTNPTTPTTPGTPTTTTGTGLSIAPGTQPLAGVAPQGAARVPFTRVVLTAGSDGDVTVNGLNVERVGPASDAVFTGIVLLDESGQQIGIDKTFNSDHRLTVGDPVVIPRGTSKTFTVAGNMGASLATYAGQVPLLAVVGVNTSATVTGTLPITGAAQTINASLTIGTAQATVSSFDPNAALTKEIGTTGYKFAGLRVQAGSAEKVRLQSIRWNQVGSVGSGDLANLATVVDGTSYPMTISSDGKYYTASFGSGIVIDKGFSKDLYVQGDIVGSSASGRTVQFDLYKTTDMYIVGETFGYGITISAGQSTASATTASEFTSGSPFFSGSVTTVSAGSITTITKSSSVPAQNIAVNVPNQPLGGFDIDIKGEPITIQSMVFSVATSSGSGTGLLTNVSLVDKNGAVVAGPVDATDATATDTIQTLTFTSTVTFPIGKGTYSLVGRLPSTSGNNQQYVVSATPSSGWTTVRGLTSGNNLTLTNGVFSMNTMTVKAAALSITVSATPVAQNIVSGGTAREFANYQFNALQSGEDVRFSSIPLQLTFNTASASADKLSNCQLWDGTTALNTGSNVTAFSSSATTPLSNTFTFDQQLVIPKGTIKTLTLKCTVSGSSGQKYSWGIAASPSIAVTGVTSSNDVAETVTASTGQLQTIASSAFTVDIHSSSPSYAIAAGGQTGVTLGALKFRATGESIDLREVALQLSNTSASSSPQNLTAVKLYDGTTLVGTALFAGAERYATSSLTTAVRLTKDTDKVITIKGDLATIGQSADGTEGALIQVNYDGDASTGTYGDGVESGARVNTGSTSDTAVAGVRTYKSYPIITYSTSSGTATEGQNDLLVLNIAAPSYGEVQMRKLVFTVATTTALVDTPTFNGPNGSVGTTALSGLGTVASPSVVTVTFDSASNTQDRTVSAGESKIYTLRANVDLTGTNSSGSVSTSLKADTEHGASALPTLMGTVTELDSQNIIWSPNATGTTATAGNDWANGYGLPGCFLTSGLGQNCQARSISSSN